MWKWVILINLNICIWHRKFKPGLVTLDVWSSFPSEHPAFIGIGYSWLYSTFTTVYLDTCFDSDLVILYLLKQPTKQNNTTWPTEIYTLGIIIMIIMTCHMSWLLCHNNTKYYEKIIESMSKLWKVPKSLTENSLLALTYNFEITGQKKNAWKKDKLKSSEVVHKGTDNCQSYKISCLLAKFCTLQLKAPKILKQLAFVPSPTRGRVCIYVWQFSDKFITVREFFSSFAIKVTCSKVQFLS